MADGKAVAAAIQEARAELLDGASIEGLFERISGEFGLNLDLVRTKFEASYGDPSRLRENAAWSQKHRGYKGRTFRVNGHTYTFIDMIDGQIAQAVRRDTNEVQNLNWSLIQDDVWRQWDD